MRINIRKKILSICSQSELGRRMNKRSQTVSLWFKNEVPAKEVVNASKALQWGVTPHELRPDLYPNPSDGLPDDYQTTEPGA